MMSPQSLPLRDIHLPTTVDWWPLAIGWWGVIILSLGGLLAAGILLSRWWQRRQQGVALQAQQAAVLNELSMIRQHFQAEQDSAWVCAALSQLLRRLCLLYFPRTAFVSLHGAPWLAFLQDKQAWRGKTLSLLSTLPYQPQGAVSTQDIDRLLADAEDWMMAVMVRYD